jgi:hypothetical protein
LIQRTLTPLSAAPVMFPPVANVQRPQRVQVRRNWTSRTTTRHQRNSELKKSAYAPGCEPNQFLNSSPPGMNCWDPAIRCSVTPLRKKSMPRVVMNDGTRRYVVITPLTSPTHEEATSARGMPTQSDSPCWSGSQNHQTRAGASANTRPTARSISPLMRSITSPAATIAIGAIDSVMFLMLSLSRKTGFFA